MLRTLLGLPLLLLSLPVIGRWLARALLLALVLLVVLAVVGGSNWWLLETTADRIDEEVDRAPQAVAAIVPGAAVRGSVPSVTLEDRLRTALELYRAKKVSRILVSGDHREDDYDEATTMGRWLVKRGVPKDHVFLDHAGLRTLDTMQRAARVYRVDSAVVCTQRFHLPRAVFLAQDAGIEAHGLVADRRVYAGRRFNRLRETFARTVAVLDAWILDREPRHLGQEHPITGDSSATW